MMLAPMSDARRSILELPDEPSGLFATGPSAQGAIAHDGDVLQAVRDALLAAFDGAERRQLLDPFAPPAARNAAVIGALRSAVARHRSTGGPLASVRDDAETLLQLFAATLGWGPAQRYLDDPRVNEVKINNCTIMVQEAGRPFVVAPERFASSHEVRSRAVQLASALGVRLDAAHPQETLPVAHGTRVHATIAPRLADTDGALVCIRRGRQEAWDLSDVLAHGTLDAPTSELLTLLCQAGCSFLIAGRTGSGKTGLLEALANSWPDTPHIITIEDHALEISIRGADSWTRELVDTQCDPQAFGRAAREALRQTPGLLLPGETRGHEAGAILALALSGHAVITTLHARSAAEAVTRFAGYAAQRGAYMYEGRRDDALRDTCAAFDVVVRLDLIESSGRRFVAEVALLDGVRTLDSGLVPELLPLVEGGVGKDGSVAWRSAALASSAALTWPGEVDRTPAPLRERFDRLRARETASGQTSGAAVQIAVRRAEELLVAGEADRALVTVGEAWRTRQDPALLGLAQRALERAPDRYDALRAEAQLRYAALEDLIERREWVAARASHDEIYARVALAAACAPSEGWSLVDERIAEGLAAEGAAADVCAEVERALTHDEPRVALELVNRTRSTEHLLSPLTVAELLRLRENALARLERRGDGGANAATVVRERRLALESAAKEN
jgi:pilus assembly protein CpaF